MATTATQSERVQNWLHRHCEHGAGIQSAVVLLKTEDGLQVAAQWPAATGASAPVVSAARAAHQRGCPVSLTPPVAAQDGPGRILALPLADGRGGAGAVAVALPAGSPVSEDIQLHRLQEAAGTLAGLLQSAGASPTAVGTRLLHFQAALLEPQSLAQAASALASTLANTLEFERVSIGLQRRDELEVIALSHCAEFSEDQELIQALGRAMQEAVDQKTSVVYPQLPDAMPLIVQAHMALAARSQSGILTVPLVNAGEPIGAVCLERMVPIPEETCREVEELACVLAPMVDLKQRAEQPWHVRAEEAVRAYWGKRNGRVRRFAWAAGLGAALLLATIPVSYRIGAPARLEGAVQRVLASPADGYLHAVQVRPGDEVKAGQPLVALAQQDLLLQSRKWEAELSQHENGAAAALARADRAQYAVARARAGEAEAQLELVRAELARSQINAPIDGIVIKGDLSQALGAPVKRGDVLLTVAPREAFRLMMEVDERDIGDVGPGRPGQVALSAIPDERIPLTVARVIPVAVTRDGRNVFEVEATFDSPPAGLRPGLQGVAKIDAGSRSMGWIVTHRIREWLQLKLWSWIG